MKANQKFHALKRIAKYLDSNKLRILMKAFIELQFNYCPLTWMFHSRQLNNKINRQGNLPNNLARRVTFNFITEY